MYPGNDDAIRAIRLITSKIADAVMEGKQMREVSIVEEAEGEEKPIEELLGPSTLEKLKSGELEFEKEEGG